MVFSCWTSTRLDSIFMLLHEGSNGPHTRKNDQNKSFSAAKLTHCEWRYTTMFTFAVTLKYPSNLALVSPLNAKTRRSRGQTCEVSVPPCLLLARSGVGTRPSRSSVLRMEGGQIRYTFAVGQPRITEHLSSRFTV